MSEEKASLAKDLKRVRAGYLANATRRYNDFNEIWLTGTVPERLLAIDLFRTAFKEFMTHHELYLQEDIDDEERKRADGQFSSLNPFMRNTLRIRIHIIKI